VAYLFVAYTVVWLGVLLYVFVLSRENQRLRAQLEALEAACAALSERAGASSPRRTGSVD